MYSELAAVGLSPFPVSDGTFIRAGEPVPAKGPIVSWKEYQTKPAEPKTLDAWEKMFSSQWVGTACGVGAGGLEVIDFDIEDHKSGKSGTPPKYKPWVKLLKEHGHEALLKSLTISKTPSGGIHVMYRCPEASSGNQKLAQRVTNKVRETFIETRGVGGYIACYPTPGYKFLNGDFASIPTLSLNDRNILIEAAKLLDEMPRVEESVPAPKSSAPTEGTRPGDDYNARMTWEELLEPLGWKRCRSWTDKVFWARPGKSCRDGHSAVQDEHLFVYSSNTDLPQEKQLSKFAVYAHAYHRGDFAKAARQLAKDGYGSGPVARGTVEVSASIQRDLEELGRKKYNQTDAGNAARFKDMFGHRVRYCHVWGKWLVWDGARWSMDEKGGANVSELCLEMAAAIAAEAAESDDKATRESLSSWAMKCEGRGKMDNCLALVKASLSVAVEPGELDADPWLLNCANGTIDLRTGELRPHDPNDLMTRLCPVEYDAEAKFPLWEKFIGRILPGPALQLFVYKALGYSLTGHTGEQCFFFLHGSQGANGKSTFMEVVQHILGGYSRAMQPDTLMLSHVARTGASPDIARLKGSRFVSAPETSAGRRLDEQLVKQLTGGDRMVARYLYQDEFEFVPELKLWITGNHKPTITGSDNAIWRRVRLVPFSVVIPEGERDADLKEKLLAEASGILRWMVMGCLDWQEEGLKAPEEVLASVAEYRSEMDTLGDFLSDKCRVGVMETIASATLYDAYRLWAIGEGLRPWTQKAFSLALQERGIERSRTMYGSEFRGVTIAG